MVDRFQQFQNLDFDAKFFHQLAAEAVLKLFSPLPFASWELPEAPEVISRSPLGHKQLSLPKHQTRGDFDAWVGAHRPMLL